MMFAASAPPLLEDLGVLVVAAAAIAYISQRVGTVPIIGFLAAGVIIGPNALALVDDLELVEQAAEIGVVLLLFTIGIEFSLSRLRQLAALILGGGLVQVGVTTGLVTAFLTITGVEWRTALFSGLLVALSSTAIVLKLLADRGRTNSPTGRVAVGFLIFQDLAIVGMVLLVPMLGEGSGGLGELFVAVAKAVGIIAAVLAGAKTIMPKVLDSVARTCSSEVFLLTITGVCFGTAYLTSLADVSVSLGAFLAGLMVSESRLSGQALSDILPLQVLFSATFFVSVGMLLDINYLIENIPLVFAIAVAVVAVKLIGTAFAAWILRQPMPAVVGSALTLAQIGEFSFVLEQVGLDAGLQPFGMNDGTQAFIAVTVVLMVLTPFAAQFGESLSDRMMLARPIPETIDEAADVPVHGHSELVDHIVIAGYGSYGEAIARSLDLVDIPYVITTLDPDVGRAAEAEGRRVLQGDIARRFMFEQAGVQRARLVVIADDNDPERLLQLSSIIANGSNTPVLTRAPTNHDAAELLASGSVSHCIADESASTDALITHVLGAVALPERLIDVVVEDIVGTAAPDTNTSQLSTGSLVVTTPSQADTGCDHVDSIRVVTPTTEGCEECIAEGARWVHLRLCVSCGHVGCCDSSPHRHARAHASSTGHPIMRSAERGEAWAWCFEDRVTIDLTSAIDDEVDPELGSSKG